MRLDWLEARSFRSYQSIRFEPSPTVNVLVGPNGAGKTNLLEAVDYVATGRSFRSAGDEDMVKIGDAEAIVRAGFTVSGRELLVETAIRRNERNDFLVNRKRLHRRGELTMAVATVAFLPDDVELVKGGPAARRDLLDDLNGRLHPTAAGEQHDFQRALRQRNALLRSAGRAAPADVLDTWDDKVAQSGALVVARRLSLLHRMAPLVNDFYERVGGSRDVIDWEYRSSWSEGVEEPPALEASLRGGLRERRKTDRERGLTTVGPQRDEPTFHIGGRDARTLASQGEQRTLALALRMASHRLLTDFHGSPPVLLLDDVFSELDAGRAAAVVEALPPGQVLVTTAREDEVPLEGRSWWVEDGRIE